jgi:hypothetical protein
MVSISPHRASSISALSLRLRSHLAYEIVFELTSSIVFELTSPIVFDLGLVVEREI